MLSSPPAGALNGRTRLSASNSSSSSNKRKGKASAKAGYPSYSQGKVDPLDLLVTVLLVKNKGQTMDAGVILDSERISTRQLTTILTKLRGRSAPATVMLRVLDVRTPPTAAGSALSCPGIGCSFPMGGGTASTQALPLKLFRRALGDWLCSGRSSRSGAR